MKPVITAARYRGCLLGLACGDAVGTTVEFCPRGSFPPVETMRGGGPFRLPVGAWTDDTSMSLCLADSLLAIGGFDPIDQLERYWRWYTQGERSSTGRCFDIGNATRAALERYRKTGEEDSGSVDPRSAGNGCIMRLAPVVLFFHPDRDAAVHFAGRSSLTTHGAPECIECSRLFAALLCAALSGSDRETVLSAGEELRFASPRVRAIAQRKYLRKSATEIKGSGYVVDCLEAALWCFAARDSFREAVLSAVNLGDDADTTAAVCGQIAGACYGDTGIPAAWREQLVLGLEIAALADALGAARPDASL